MTTWAIAEHFGTSDEHPTPGDCANEVEIIIRKLRSAPRTEAEEST